MTKQKKIIIWIIIFLIIFVLSLATFKYKTGEFYDKQNKRICCNNTCFNVEIADDEKSRQLWLMYRENLDYDKWMLFVYDNPWIYSFRMKNTLIPLAWIRLDSNLKIVDIKMMDPCKSQECPSYTPKSEAQYVLEINQWIITEKSILDNCVFR